MEARAAAAAELCFERVAARLCELGVQVAAELDFAVFGQVAVALCKLAVGVTMGIMGAKIEAARAAVTMGLSLSGSEQAAATAMRPNSGQAVVKVHPGSGEVSSMAKSPA